MIINPISYNQICKPKPICQNIYFKGLENKTSGSFVSSTNTQENTNQLTPNEKAKLRKHMWECIHRNDMEGLKAILQGEYVTLSLLRTAKRYYDSECRMVGTWYGSNEKPDPAIGTYIHDVLINAELQKKSNAKSITNPYLYMIDHIKYGTNKEEYAISMIKKAIESKDSNLLRIVIETLRHENKPYAEILLKSINQQGETYS